MSRKYNSSTNLIFAILGVFLCKFRVSLHLNLKLSVFCYNTGQFFKLSSPRILEMENYIENRSNPVNCLIRRLKSHYNKKSVGSILKTLAFFERSTTTF